MKNWEDLTSTSELLAAQEIRNSFLNNDLQEVEVGLDYLIDSMAKADKRALESQLIRLMMHLIKWNIQTEKRSRSWLLTINNARYEIKQIQKYTPSLNSVYVIDIWQDCFEEAKKEAEIETGISTSKIETITWQEVFEDEYHLGSSPFLVGIVIFAK